MNPFWKNNTAAMQILLAINELFMTSDAGCEKIIQLICEQIVAHCSLRGALIGRLAHGARLQAIGVAGLETCDLDRLRALQHAATAPGRPAVQAAESGRMLVMNQLPAAPGYAPWRQWAEQAGIRAALFCPLKLPDGAAGVLAVYAAQQEEFDARAQAVIQTLASNIAFGLHMKQEAASRRTADRQLELAAAVFDNAAEGIVITDPKGGIIAVNHAVCQVTGYNREELIGQNPRIFASGRHGKDFYRRMWESIRHIGLWQGEIYNRRKNGEIYPEWLSIVGVRDAHNKLTNFIAIFTDITRQKENEARLNYLAFHDALTGLPNRVLFQDRLAQAIARSARDGKKMALLFIDLDRFKDVNDTAGHAVGDLLLRAVASRLGACVRSDDTLARLGGDEFTMIVRDVHTAIDAAQVADRVLHHLTEPFCVDGKTFYVTPSIGIGVFPEDGHSPGELMKKADAAMYRAKDLGRNSYKFYTEDMNIAMLRRVAMEQMLRNAQAKGELSLLYQPQVDTTTRKITGMEALLRWQNPQLGAVSPSEFIPIAEETGVIHEIGEWVLQTACRQARTWHEQGYPAMRISVNLSASQFRQRGIVEVVQRALAASGLAPSCLELELTETVAMQPGPDALAILQSLKQLGVRIALDDFGTGYSSLSYLRKFPIDTLKIDRTFINELHADPHAGPIIQAIITMARSLELNVIAEGVETAHQADFLLTYMCNEIQGFFFYRPGTPAQCGGWLANGTAGAPQCPCTALSVSTDQ